MIEVIDEESGYYVDSMKREWWNEDDTIYLDHDDMFDAIISGIS